MKNILSILLVSLLVSCGIQKRDFEPQRPVAVDQDYLHQESDNSFKNTTIATQWWKEFNDPILDTLIERARANNLDINAAVANFTASRALLRGTKFDRWPTVTAGGDYSRTRLGEDVFGQSNPTYNTFNGSFDAVWEADVFGRVSNRIKGAYANEQLALADMHGVYISIFAEVATTYLEIRGNQQLLDIARQNLEGQRETYKLTLQLSRAGTSNDLDVSRAKAQLEMTRASVPVLQARLEALKNSLSVLVGSLPGEPSPLLEASLPLPSLPQSIEIGDVQQLLRRRPDVRAAEAALQKQIAQYNISVADLYPRIQFGGSIGFSAVDFANFGNKESFTWSVMPSISWAAFNLGRVRQQIKKEDALTLAALNQYEKVILEGLEELKTALSNYAHLLKRREILRESSLASAQAANFARQRYNAGLDNFIDYLSAENMLLMAQNTLALSEIASATSLISIYKALGGGWEIVSGTELDTKMEAMSLAETKTD